MKKVILSLTTAAALSTFAMAGGDIDPTSVAQPDNSGFYFGIGYSAVSSNFDNFTYNGTAQNGSTDTDESGGLFQAGYQINEYVSLEGRWTHFKVKSTDSWGNEISASIDNIGLYVKPQYTFGNVTAYALLGYGWTDMDFTAFGSNFNDTDGDFQWGLGAAFHLSKNASIFADYTHMHNGGSFEDTVNGNTYGFDADVYSFNIGMNYKF